MEDHLKKYRDRLRIVIILYVFSEPLTNTPGLTSLFRTEIRIQALDFLLRYPDFFAMELLKKVEEVPHEQSSIKLIIDEIFNQDEPDLRVEEMQKFFHGAYESVDDVIGFLCSTGFIKYESRRRTDGKEYDKLYYMTDVGKSKIEANLLHIPSVKWYHDRCELINKYFGSLSGSDLKKKQYLYVQEYASVPYTHKIRQIQYKVKESYFSIFNAHLP